MVPDGWLRVATGDVVEIRRGLSWKKPQETRTPAPGAVAVLRIPNIQSRLVLDDIRYINGISKERLDRFSVGEGWTLMVASNGNPRRVGNCCYISRGEPVIFASFLIALRPNAPTLTPEYLHRILAGPQVQNAITDNATGSTGLKNINKDALLLAPILLPPLGEQRKIAAILGSVDEAIERTQAVIDQVQVVKQALMQQLLTRGLPGRHTRFKQTEIGEIPESWEVRQVASVLSEKPASGRSPQSRSSPPGVPTFSIGAVRNGRVNILEHVKYCDMDPADQERFRVARNDILVVRGNANPSLVGRCGIVGSFPAGCIYPDILVRIRAGEEIEQQFLAEVWNSDIVHDQLLQRAKTTNGTYKINQSDIQAVQIPLPSRQEQVRILQCLEAVDVRLGSEQRTLAREVALKQSLMSVLLTGELRVTP